MADQKIDWSSIPESDLEQIAKGDLRMVTERSLKIIAGQPLSLVEQIPGGEGVMPTADASDNSSVFDKFKAGARAVGSTVQNMAMAVPASFAGAGAQIASGRLGTQDTRAQSEAFNKIMDIAGAKPISQLEKDYTKNLGESLNNAGLQAIPGFAPELGVASRLAKPAAIDISSRQIPVPSFGGKASSLSMKDVGSSVVSDIGGMPGSMGGAITAPIRNTAALLTDKNPASISRIYSDARAGNKTAAMNMRGQIPESQVLADAKQGIRNAQQLNQKEYLEAKSGWAADKTPLDFSPIDSEFNRLLSSLKEGSHFKIGSVEANKIAEVQKVLDEWRSDPSVHTTVGLDALKQRIDAIYPDSPMQNQAQRVITGTSKAVKDTIMKQAPDYADAMVAYKERLDTIRDIDNALSLGNKKSKDQAIARLKTLAKRDSHFRQAMAQQLSEEGGVDVMGAISGMDMQSWLPQRFGKMNALGVGSLSWAAHNPIAAGAVLPFTSPRLVGEIANAAGVGMNKVFGPVKRQTGLLNFKE